jgi:hypothetical protein
MFSILRLGGADVYAFFSSHVYLINHTAAHKVFRQDLSTASHPLVNVLLSHFPRKGSFRRALSC